MINIYYIRHAESLGNVNHHIVGGRSNHLPLSERGESQAHSLGKRLRSENLSFDFAFSSIAVRAQSTAKIVCSYIDFPEENIHLSDEIVELSQGDWEGEIRKEKFTDEVLAEIKKNPYVFKAPNGESQAEVGTRMFNFLERTVKRLDNGKPLNLAVFTHGFAIKTLVQRIMNSDPAMTYWTVIHNTSLTCFKFKQNQWIVDRINDHSHLAGTEFIGHY
jgi:broad specificity phosphatase PhoE